MSLRLTYRKSRSKKKAARGSYYIEGTDHKGERVHESLRTGDRDLAKRLFAKWVSDNTTARVDGPKGVANFANAVKVYMDREGENSNATYLDEMLPIIGAKKLCELQQSDLDDLAAKMRPGVSKATLKRHVYTPFMAAYNAAVENEPPLADVRKWKAPTVAKKAVESPSDAYIEALIAGVRTLRRTGKRNNVIVGSRKQARDIAAVLMMTLTGCRSGEATAVTKADVDLDRNRVTFRKTKNGKPRQVAIHPALAKALRDRLAEMEGQPADARLFEFETRWGLPQMVARARRRAGLPHYRPHQIGRHAFATRLLHDGASLLDVQQAGGWDTQRMVSEYYGHLAQEHVDKIVTQSAAGSFQESTPKLHHDDKSDIESTGNKGENAA